MYVSVCTHACMGIYKHAYMYVRAHTRTHTLKLTQTRMYMYLHRNTRILSYVPGAFNLCLPQHMHAMNTKYTHTTTPAHAYCVCVLLTHT